MFEEPPLDEVEAGVADIRSPDVGVQSFTLPLVLEFVNTADQSVPDLSFDLTIGINDERVAETGSDVGTLRAGRSDTARVDPLINYGDISNAVIAVIEQGSFTLALNGVLRSEQFLVNAEQRFEGSVSVGE